MVKTFNTEVTDDAGKRKKLSIALVPGGFSEAVWSNRGDKVEYCQLLERKGFTKLAIQQKVELVPVYQFGITKLYSQPTFLRSLRAKLAQAYKIPMVCFFGKLLLPLPHDVEVCVIVILMHMYACSQN